MLGMTIKKKQFKKALGQRAGVLQVAADDGVGGAKRQRQNCGSGIHRGILREGRAAENEEIGELPVLQVRVDDGEGGGVAHDRAALDVRGLVARGIVATQA